MDCTHPNLPAPPDTAPQLGGASHHAEFDLREVVLMLWRRKLSITAIMIIGIMLTALLISILPPRYSAQSVVLVNAEQGQDFSGMNVGALLGGGMGMGLGLDSSFVLNEVEILRSRTLIRKVIERLNLIVDPEFNPRLAAADLPVRSRGEGAFKTLSIYKEELDSLPAQMVEEEIELVITEFLEHLKVRSIAGSHAIVVQFEATDPYKAAKIANIIVEIYLEQRLEDKLKAAQKFSGWLDTRLKELRLEVQKADEDVYAYKLAHGIVADAQIAASGEPLVTLNKQLILAQTQKAEAIARLQQIERLMNEGGDIESLEEVTKSDLIKNLRLEEIKISQALSQLSSRYGPKHPQIIKLHDEQNKINKTLRIEIKKIVTSLKNELSVADARIDALQRTLEQLSDETLKDGEDIIDLATLEHEATAARMAYSAFLEIYQRSNKQEALKEADAHVISYASPPDEASFPNTPLLLSLSAIVSLFLGLAIAFIIERFDNTFRSAKQLEQALNYPCYALIPAIKSLKQTKLCDYVIERPSSMIAEAVRTLRMVINFRSTSKPRVITVTSSFPGEGKTTLSIWLARLAAKSGERVIIIDGDLRKPNLHRSLEQDNTVSLVEYLTGQKELKDVVQKDEATGLHMIYGRSVPNSALDLIGSAKMQQLIAALRQEYDLVILDSPACLAASDARVLANYADQTLYAVGWNRTPCEVVQSGVKQFADMGYHNLATVLTAVDVQRHAQYGFGDTIYYYGRYKEYYSA